MLIGKQHKSRLIMWTLLEDLGCLWQPDCTCTEGTLTLLDDSRAAKANTRRWPPIQGLLTSICVVPAGASGKLDPIMSQEYGSQDFFGVIDELRIWRTVRNEDQIKQARFTLCP